jgi:hydrogenase maturation protease
MEATLSTDPQPPASPTKILVIGYGNDLRSDDAIGRRVAEEVTAWSNAAVRSLAVPQLTPELADPLAGVDVAIFVDAIQTSDPVAPIQLHQLPQPTGEIPHAILAHTSHPQALLFLTQAVYRRCPQAWWLMVPGTHFGVGNCLSPTAQQGVIAALETIAHLIHLADPPTPVIPSP